ncbi:MAG: hypothetical protein MUF15_15845 [Acidobacteria bacterium]|nr:hypothetical protein [Acidobacteriota bacterium]
MKVEKVEPDPFPPPCRQAIETGVVELLARRGLYTNKSKLTKLNEQFRFFLPSLGFSSKGGNKYGLSRHIIGY